MHKYRPYMAIVGYGFVGKAVDYGFPDSLVKKIYIDPLQNTSIEDLKDKNIDISFVCVPTPIRDDARIDSRILENTVEELLLKTTGLIVIKSTAIPSIIKKLSSKSSRIIYNPEFLTERNANEDFINPEMHIFGGIISNTKKVEDFYKKYSICAHCEHIFHMTVEEASFVKYTVNTYLMSKVLWFNQLYDIISSFDQNLDYNKIVHAACTDKRIGKSHTQIPGHDGRRGSAGACFAKDGPSFAMFAKDVGCDFTLLEEVLLRNQDYRNSYGAPLEREKEQNIRFDYKFK